MKFLVAHENHSNRKNFWKHTKDEISHKIWNVWEQLKLLKDES